MPEAHAAESTAHTADAQTRKADRKAAVSYTHLDVYKRQEEKRASASPEKSEKTEECTTNTDKVDREIRELRKKKKELEQKLARSDGPEEKKRLETQLQQTERELQMKDNDSYRRSHAQYS